MGFFTSALSSLAGSIPGLSDVGGVLVAFFTTVTDPAMWRSLGWLLLGIILIGAGLTLWTKQAVIPAVRSAVA